MENESENEVVDKMSELADPILDIYDDQLTKCETGHQALMLASAVLDRTIKVLDVLITKEGRQQLFKELSNE